MGALKRVTTGLSTAIFAACCGLFLLFSVSGTGWKLLAVPTGSMNPSMPPGSLALVHKVRPTSLKVGDVITYTNPLNSRATISHRVIQTYMVSGKVPGFVTKGDANPTADAPVVAGSVQGKVITHVPYLGHWLLGSKTWVSVVLFVYVPALLIMLEELQRLSTYYKSKSRLPYKLPELLAAENVAPSRRRPEFAAASVLVVVILGVGLVFTPQAFALLQGHMVSLAPNRLRVAAAPKPPTCSSSTTIQIQNNSTQTGATGQATGGSATTGNVTNNNTTTMSINVQNGC